MKSIDAPPIVIGAGPAGLATASTLGRRGIRCVVLERSEHVASSWRTRYDGLELNSFRWASNMPGTRMPSSFGDFPSRDDYVAYLEHYTRRNGIEVRLGTDVRRVGQADDGWIVETSGGELRSGTVVVATGPDRVPFVPDWPGRATFDAQLIHSSDYTRPVPFTGGACSWSAAATRAPTSRSSSPTAVLLRCRCPSGPRR